MTTPEMRQNAGLTTFPADACLVRLAELHSEAKVFTLDSDFRIYRRHGNKAIPLLIPES